MKFFVIFLFLISSCSVIKEDFKKEKLNDINTSQFDYLDKNKNGFIDRDEFKEDENLGNPLYVFFSILGIVFLIMLVPTLQYSIEKIINGRRNKKSLQ